jgi:hypothetical protein
VAALIVRHADESRKFSHAGHASHAKIDLFAAAADNEDSQVTGLLPHK